MVGQCEREVLQMDAFNQDARNALVPKLSYARWLRKIKSPFLTISRLA
jgi:hypothetical protein